MSATAIDTPVVIPPRTALHAENAPLAMLWFTCTRDLDALAVSMESAVDLVPAGTTFHLVFDAEDRPPPPEAALDRLRAFWPACHVSYTHGGRDPRLKGAEWVANQFVAFAEAMRINPGARYLAKIDSDVVLFGNSFLRTLRPERWMMHGQGATWRGYNSAWGGLYFLHRAFIEAMARHENPVALLHEVNQARNNRFGDFPEDQTVSQLAVHLFGERNVWFQPPGDWISALLGRWHYTYPDTFRNQSSMYAMAELYKLTRAREFRPAVLKATLASHDRQFDYDRKTRKE